MFSDMRLQMQEHLVGPAVTHFKTYCNILLSHVGR